MIDSETLKQVNGLFLHGCVLTIWIPAKCRKIEYDEIDTLDIQAGFAREYEISDLTKLSKMVKPGEEVWLRVSIHEKTDRLWCEAGYEVAKQQFRLPIEEPKPAVSSVKGLVNVNDTDDSITISGPNIEIVFDKHTGYLSSYNLANKEVLDDPLKFNFWRPQTDNDRWGGKTDIYQAYWKELADKLKTESVRVVSSATNKCVVEVIQSEGSKLSIHTRYSVLANGVIKVSSTLDADLSLPNLIRFGMSAGVSGKFEDIKYFGKGPLENYWDRNQGAEVDVHQSKASDMYFDYMRPQENGNRTNVRWLELSGKGYPTIRVLGAPQFGFSLWPYTLNNVDEAVHPYELQPLDYFTLNIDSQMMGIGGRDAWTWKALPMEKYSLPAGKYQMNFSIEPRH